MTDLAKLFKMANLIQMGILPKEAYKIVFKKDFAYSTKRGD